VTTSDETFQGLEIPPEIPDSLRQTRSVGGIRFLSGVGKDGLTRIMWIATSSLEEEHADSYALGSGPDALRIAEKPRYLKTAAGVQLKDLAASVGLDMDEHYYTAVVKWLLPRAKRTKPSKKSLDAGRHLLEQEIAAHDPEIIVCLGKPAFDMLSGTKFKLHDIAGAWFQADLAGRTRRLYPMEEPQKLVARPELLEQFRLDMVEIRRMLDRIDGVHVDHYPEKYEVIKTSTQLKEWVTRMQAGNYKLFSVDCEWHGRNHIDGELRSFQLCWAPGEACFIKFRDQKRKYTFDVSYKEAGEILQPLLNHPDVKYVGHHISADFPWMHTWLGLDWYDKAICDTEFAQQCVDENAPLGLERMAMAYTDMGRWDIDLTHWCKKNAKKVEDGYGYVPDEILEPYATRDVDGPFRCVPILISKMYNDIAGPGLFTYYTTMLNEFVTNVFTSWCLWGLPIDQNRVDFLRDLYQWARKELDVEFREAIVEEAGKLLYLRLARRSGVAQGLQAYEQMEEMIQEETPDVKGAHTLFKKIVGVENLREDQPVFDHWLNSPDFNVNSPDQVRRWLFQVKGYQPVKSTNQKEKGLPSMPWEKVMELPEDRQKDFKPSTDKQTIDILQSQHDDQILTFLRDFKDVGTVCKSFLGEAEKDEDGNLIKEKGIHAFIASSGNLHGMYSTTETGRPRSWQPNTLNLPGWVNKRIDGAIHKLVCKRYEQNRLPSAFEHLAEQVEKDGKLKFVHKIPSIRSIVTMPDGWCITESDYQTAELRGWAYISGCQKMIDLIIKPDKNFARVKPEKMVDEDCVCRLDYPEELAAGMTEEEKEKYRMTYTVDGDVKATFTEDDLERDAEGNIVFYKQDLHWGLAEDTFLRIREVLNKKSNRSAGKTGNFSTAYGATGNTLDRKIEADTGEKPEPGTGDKILDALERRQPVAFAFMREMERTPEDPGYIQAASGRVRHFHTHPDVMSGMVTYRQRQGLVSALGREARNFKCQESVAATAIRAANYLLRLKMTYSLDGRPGAVLYDSAVTFNPAEERELWRLAHDVFMYLGNGWEYHDRVLRYPVDHELNKSWSWSTTEQEAAEIQSVDISREDKIVALTAWLVDMKEKLIADERLGLKGPAWVWDQRPAA
jgi:uracil-DNA glycosylase family 4